MFVLILSVQFVIFNKMCLLSAIDVITRLQ